MIYRLWQLAFATLIVMGVSLPAQGYAAIWMGSTNLEDSAFLTFILIATGTFGFAAWTDIAKPHLHKPKATQKLGREQKRKLKERERELALEKAIKQLEREVYRD
jgi:hypothetical protein